MTTKEKIEYWVKISIEAVYLFGSHAKGTASKDSDIDVALVVNHFDGVFFDVIPPIWLLRESVDFRIEPHVIARDTVYTGFLDEIHQTGVRIS